MEQSRLNEFSSRHKIPQKKTRNAIMAFISGGLMAVLAQLIQDGLTMYFSKENATILTILLFILLAGVFTGFGIYDKMAKKTGAGFFVPITGFSNALTSSAMECKREGFIYGIGSNMFKLAGSVITYGIVSAIVFSLIRYGISLL